MARDTIVTGSKLTALANAIRAKTEGSASLTLDQMAAEIGNIKPTLSSLGKVLLAEGSYVSQGNTIDIAAGDFGVSDGINTRLRDYAFAQNSSGVACCRAKTVEIPSWITRIGREAFSHAKYLEGITFQGGTSDPLLSCEMYAFGNIECTGFKRLIIPRKTSIGQYFVAYSSALELVDVVVAPSRITDSSAAYVPSFAFNGLSKLDTVIFRHRKTYDGVANGTHMAMNNSSIFDSYSTKNVTKVVLDTDEMVEISTTPSNTPFRYFIGATVYVTDSLLPAYQADAAWQAAITTYGNITLDAISNYVPS